MSFPPTNLTHGPLRAPQQDGTALVEPSWEAFEGLLRRNVQLRNAQQYDFQGHSLGELRRRARQELLAEARRFTAAYRDVDPHGGGPAELIFLAGHQPQLFHPGVWLKNFALAALARRHAAVAVNLLIDSDTVKSTALRVPGGSVQQPRAEMIPLDRPGPAVPFEERRIADRELFESFGRRAAGHLASLVPDPLLETYWPLAVARARQTDNLGACLAQSRHQLEGDWGLQTLEVPQSRVCSLPSFGWLVAHVLAQLPRFRRVYNQAVQEYRRAHRIRSAAHPVPELAADGDWLEAPLWVFSAAQPRRRPLFCRPSGDRVLISDRGGIEVDLPLRPDGDAGRAVERLEDLAARGVKIRSRALMTTLWARLVLGDVFLHGIGGAKYDQLTDVLLARFLGLVPPEFMVLSATLHLPIRRQRFAAEQSRRVKQQLRRLAYHPERFVNGLTDRSAEGPREPWDLIAAKNRWIATSATPENARTRCHAIRRVNEALQPWVEPRRRRLLARQAELQRGLRAERILGWREYGFCLYPQKTLREFLDALLPKSS